MVTKQIPLAFSIYFTFPFVSFSLASGFLAVQLGKALVNIDVEEGDIMACSV